MADARQLVAEIRSQLKAVEERLMAHPYLAALERGELLKDKLRLFAGEQYHIINSDLRSIALVVNRHGHLPSRPYFIGALQGEAAARDALMLFAKDLGMEEDELRRYEPSPGCQAYPAYVAWLALYGTDAHFAAAFLLNLPAWGANCGRMSVALKSNYGLSSEAVSFFELFAQPGSQFEAGSLQVIQAGLDRGVEPMSIARAARLIQAYELMYWDALYEASK